MGLQTLITELPGNQSKQEDIMHGKLIPDQHGTGQEASLQLWEPQQLLKSCLSLYFQAKT